MMRKLSVINHQSSVDLKVSGSISNCSASWRMKTENSGGYTFVELLIFLTISTFIFGVGYASYRDFTSRQVLDASYKNLESQLNLARELALAGQKPSDCEGSTLNGYLVEFSQSLNQVTIKPQCSFANGTIKSDVATTKTIDVSKGIQITTSVPNSTILFKVLGQGTDLQSGETLTLRQTGSDQEIDAVITKDGRLQKQ